MKRRKQKPDALLRRFQTTCGWCGPVTGLDSEARRNGDDFMYMTCTEACARSLKTAFQREIEIGKGLGLT